MLLTQLARTLAAAPPTCGGLLLIQLGPRKRGNVGVWKCGNVGTLYSRCDSADTGVVSAFAVCSGLGATSSQNSRRTLLAEFFSPRHASYSEIILGRTSQPVDTF
ncbi:hypothetical protein F4861DRAFT_509437 [Xylaria intraflava]|nr:hypothetical protein F4861DRAFT_509437 [Xylaria intraflava]